MSFLNKIKTEMIEKNNNIERVLIIDGDFYLRRQCSVIFKNYTERGFNKEDLIKELLNSYYIVLNSTKNAVNCNNVIIVWDFPPYKRMEVIKSYKSNRYNEIYEHRIETILKDESLDNDEKNQLIEEIKLEKDLDEVRITVRQNILKDEKIPSIIIKGCEADDLGFYLSNIYSRKGIEVIVATSDSDWTYMLNEKISQYNPISKEVKTYEENHDKIYKMMIKKFPHHYIKAIYEVWNGSHNNVQMKLNKRKKKIYEYLEDGIKGRNLGLTQILNSLSPKIVKDIIIDNIENINEKILIDNLKVTKEDINNCLEKYENE